MGLSHDCWGSPKGQGEPGGGGNRGDRESQGAGKELQGQEGEMGEALGPRKSPE